MNIETFCALASLFGVSGVLPSLHAGSAYRPVVISKVTLSSLPDAESRSRLEQNGTGPRLLLDGWLVWSTPQGVYRRPSWCHDELQALVLDHFPLMMKAACRALWGYRLCSTMASFCLFPHLYGHGMA